MESIFDKSANQKIIARIDTLTPEHKAQWGKMQVDQMLAHCQQPLKVAAGELKLKRGLIGMLFGKMARKKMAGNDDPFDKSLPTDPHFIVKDHRDFETEKQNLKNHVQRMAEKGPAILSTQPHPFFGPLTEKEWDILQMKHLDHHLRQFGV
jgi:hypothetical protein